MTHPSSSVPRLLFVAALSALAACGDKPSDPANPGQVSAFLVSPNGAEGAVLLEIAGSGVRGVTVSGGTAFVEDGSPPRALLVLDAPGEVRFSVALDDVDRRPTFSVVEVSGPQDEVRGSVAGYRVELAP
jgi:hypothetical protein